MSSITLPNTYMPTGIGQTPPDPTPSTGVPGGTSGVTGGGPVQTPVGAGTVSQSVSVPGTQGTTTAQQSFMMTAILESLHKFMPEISGDDQDVLLAQVQSKMKETVNRTDNEEVRNKSESRERQLEERKKKLDEAEKKLQEMIKLQNSGDILDKIKLAFEILGALIFTAIVTIGTLGAGTAAGVAVGVALIIGAVAGDVMALNDVLQKSTGLGIAGNIAKSLNPHDPGAWSKADQIFTYTLMGIAAAAMVVGMATGYGEEQFAQMLPKMIKNAADVERATHLLNIGNTVVTAVADVGAAVTHYETTNIQAQAKKDQARAKELQALMKHLDQMIDLAIKRLQENGDRWVKMLDSITQSMQDRAETVGKAKLTA